MAIQIDYFLASDDAAALRMLEEPAGPRSASPDVVATSDVDPGLALGYLHERLTGTSVEDYLQLRGPALIGESTDEQKVLLELDAQLVRLLAELPEPLAELGRQWAGYDAGGEQEWAPSPRDLEDFLVAVRAMAQRSLAGEGSVYCWLWP